MDHSYFKDRISGYYDNNLPPYEQQSVEEHLKSCEECQKMLVQFEKLEKLIDEKSMLSDTEYWEKSAQKIENAIGISDSSKVVDVSRNSFKGLFWKISAAAASIAALTFIAINQNDIAPEAQMKVSQPPEIQVENKLDIDTNKVIEETIVKEKSAKTNESDETVDEFIETDKIEPTIKLTGESDELVEKDEIEIKEKPVQKIQLDTVVKKEIVNDVIEIKPKVLARAPQPTAVAPQYDAIIESESIAEPVITNIEGVIVQSESNSVYVRTGSGSVELFLDENNKVIDKSDIKILRKKKDSLCEIYSSYSHTVNKRLKTGKSKTTSDQQNVSDSSKSVIEKELLDTQYKIGLNSENELEKLEAIRFFENYINRKEAIYIDLAKKYQAELKK